MSMGLDMLKNLKILYAEDDIVVANSMMRILSVFSNNVVYAKDGAAAIKIYEDEKPNIIILDIKMPIMNGIEVASIIRKSDILTPIIIATNHKESDDILKAITLNLAAYIIKPVKIDNLQTALLDALKKLDAHGLLVKKVSDTVFYNHTTKTLTADNLAVKLTKNEILLFELLLKKQGSLVTYDYIEEQIGVEFFTTKASIKNAVLRIRKKLGEKIIVNVQDLGYMLL